MMYSMNMHQLRGMHFQTVPPRGATNLYAPRDLPDGVIAGSEDGSDDETEGGYDSVHSPSLTDNLYDLHARHRELSQLSQEYGEYLHDDMGVHQEVGVSSESDGEGGSAVSSRSRVSRLATPPSNLASRLMDIGIFDLEFADGPGFIGDEDRTDEDSHETDSEGELTNLNSDGEDDDDVGSIEDEFDEVPNPPQLPSVSEERLQEVWPLGDQSFSIFLCPITHDVMTDPVVSADGYTYERAAIARWFETSRKSPVTGQALPNIDLVPNQSVRTLLKTLIDMTADTKKASGGSTPSPAAPSPSSQAAAEHRKSSKNSVSSEIPASSSTSGGIVRRRGSREALADATDDVLPPPPTTLLADAPREQNRLSPTGEFSVRRSSPTDELAARRSPQALSYYALPDAASLYRSEELEAAVERVASRAEELEAAVERASSMQSDSPQRRQPRAHSSQVLLGSGHPNSPPPQREPPTGHVPVRPMSQPQSNSQSSSGSGNGAQQQRTQSFSGCPQQRSQAPSTALPPLRPGHAPQRASQTPPMPESAGPRGSSPPLSVLPLAYRNSVAQGRCLPGNPPFPSALATPEGSPTSSNASGIRRDAEASFSPSRAAALGSHRGSHKRSNSNLGLDQ